MSKAVTSYKQQSVKSKQRKRSKSPIHVKAFEEPILKSWAEYIRGLRQDWEDSP